MRKVKLILEDVIERIKSQTDISDEEFDDLTYKMSEEIRKEIDNEILKKLGEQPIKEDIKISEE